MSAPYRRPPIVDAVPELALATLIERDHAADVVTIARDAWVNGQGHV